MPPPKRVSGRSRVDNVRRALANALIPGEITAFALSLSPCVSPNLPAFGAFTCIRPPLRPQPPRLSTAWRRVAKTSGTKVKAPCDLRLPTDTADVLGRQAVPPLLADETFVPAQKPPHADGVVLLVPAQRPLPHNGIDTAVRGRLCAGRVVDRAVLLQVAVPARTVAVVPRAVAPLCRAVAVLTALCFAEEAYRASRQRCQVPRRLLLHIGVQVDKARGLHTAERSLKRAGVRLSRPFGPVVLADRERLPNADLRLCLAAALNTGAPPLAVLRLLHVAARTLLRRLEPRVRLLIARLSVTTPLTAVDSSPYRVALLRHAKPLSEKLAVGARKEVVVVLVADANTVIQRAGQAVLWRQRPQRRRVGRSPRTVPPPFGASRRRRPFLAQRPIRLSRPLRVCVGTSLRPLPPCTVFQCVPAAPPKVRLPVAGVEVSTLGGQVFRLQVVRGAGTPP